MLNTWICNNDQILIYSNQACGNIELNIIKGTQSFNSEVFFLPIERNDSTTLLLYSDEDCPYGFLRQDTVVSYISNLELTINGKPIHIPKYSFSDLLFPNFCYTDMSIKPLQAFTSEDQKYVYIYIFEEIRTTSKISRQQAFYHSYMAKLIVNLSTGYQSRIVIRWNEMGYYNWDNCINFVGF